MRGRVMGMRVLAVCGLPLGLLASGPIVAHLGTRPAPRSMAASAWSATLPMAYRCAMRYGTSAPANTHA